MMIECVCEREKVLSISRLSLDRNKIKEKNLSNKFNTNPNKRQIKQLLL